MAVSYKKLWKLLIDKDMKKKDLCAKAGISPASITKMGKNGHVTTEILLKICTALDCQVEDIMEIVPETKQGPLFGTVFITTGSFSYGIRKVTPKECLALHGFPNSFGFSDIPIRSAYKQCGNSVVVPVVQNITEQIKGVLQQCGRLIALIGTRSARWQCKILWSKEGIILV